MTSPQGDGQEAYSPGVLACHSAKSCRFSFTAVLLGAFFFFFQAEDGIRDLTVTGVQTCALPISWLLAFCHARNPALPEVTVTELTVASVSPACGRFALAAAAASWDPIQSGSPPDRKSVV